MMLQNEPPSIETVASMPSKADIKRINLINEILSTEKTYIENLMLLEDVYTKPKLSPTPMINLAVSNPTSSAKRHLQRRRHRYLFQFISPNPFEHGIVVSIAGKN